MTRRELIKSVGAFTVAAVHPFQLMGSGAFMQQRNPPGPSEAQQRWMDLKLGMFIHFSINTYYDTEWSDGSLDPAAFYPRELDTDQWCEVAKAAGMRYIVVVAKHHDGFCIWPTKETGYCVSASPFKGDLLDAIIRSARKYDLQVGLYYSLWDCHEKTHDTDEWKYVEFMKKQLRELLTQYGPILEIWFDGFWKKQQSGWSSANAIEGESIERDQSAREEAFILAWRMEGAYRWQMDHLYQYIKSLQPDCLVMNNATTAYPGVPLHPVDVRCGEKATQSSDDRKIWNFRGKDIFMPLQIETTLSTKGDKRFPSGNWFWHAWDHSVATKEQIILWQNTAAKKGANLLMNVGPMANGKLRPEDVSVLRSLGKS